MADQHDRAWDIQVFGVNPETRAGLGELPFSLVDHGHSATVYVDVPSAAQLKGAVEAVLREIVEEADASVPDRGSDRCFRIGVLVLDRLGGR